MDQNEPQPPEPKRRRSFLRTLAIFALLFVVAVVVLVAGLPWLLSTSPARPLVVAQINKQLAPGKVQVGSLDLAWTRPIRITNLVLKDPRGKAVVTAPLATLNRSLIRLILDRPQYGTLTLDRAAVDIERRADGSIDLSDALEGAMKPDPKDPDKPSDPATEFALKVERGTLKLMSPELIEPILAEQLDMTLTIPAAPNPLAWQIKLANPSDIPGTTALELTGHYDHRAPKGTSPELAVEIQGSRWPLSVGAGGVKAHLRYDGKLAATQKGGLWMSSGDARALGLDAAGEPLGGDRLRLDRVAAIWDLGQGTGGGWTVRQLDVTSPAATVTAKGSPAGPPGTASRVEANIDLAALAKQLPHALKLRDGIAPDRGSARVALDVVAESDGGQRFDLEAHIADLVARAPGRDKPIALHEPATLTATVTRKGEDIKVGRLTVKAAFLDAKGEGDLDKGIALAATIDLGGLQGQLEELVDFGKLKMSGQARLAADYRRLEGNFSGRAAAEFHKLQVAGLLAEPIVRDSARVEAAVGGPAAPNGLPADWATAKLGLRSGPFTADLTAAQDANMSAVLTASGPVVVSGQAALAGARVSAARLGTVVEVRELQVKLRPASGADLEGGTVSLALRGRYDSATGRAEIFPLGSLPSSPIGMGPDGIKVSGLAGTAADIQVDGLLLGDLDALDRAAAAWGGSARSGVAGPWSLRVAASGNANRPSRIDTHIDIADLIMVSAAGRPRESYGAVGMDLSAAYAPEGDLLTLETLKLASRYFALDANGTIRDPAGRRLADLNGMLNPAWAEISGLAAQALEPGAKVAGQPRAFRLKGELSGGSAAVIARNIDDAEFGIDLTETVAYGVRVGPTPVIVRCSKGNIAIDPILTTVNNGQADIRPVLVLDDGKGATVLRLATGSSINGAEINDEVSTKLLSFVAPVLHQATQVRGKLGVKVDEAEFPLAGAPDRSLTLTGLIVFQDVVFGPGPLAEQMLGVIGKADAATLRLHQPLKLAVADGRVSQSGLTIPIIGTDAKVTMEGSVGFDQTLKLRAGVPITPAMMGNRADVKELLGDTTVALPIGGTLTHPRLDKDALRVGARDLGRNVIKRGAAKGVERLKGEATREAQKALGGLLPNGGAAGGAGATGQPGQSLLPDPRDLGDELFRRVLPGGNRAPRPR